jgi:Glycosyl transferase family 2
MRIFGITVVRDVVDTIRVCLLHHLQLGLEHILVLDNGSSDGTATVLRRMQRSHSLSVTRDEGPFRHDELATGLLHEAARRGADWVVPFDADEFLAPDEPLASRLGYVRNDGLLVEVVNFVQERRRRRLSPRGLLTMTRRVREPVDAALAPALARAGRLAVVEAAWPRKLVLRASSEARLAIGNHGADGLGELELADWCRFLHAPLRARAGLARSAEHGRRLNGLRSPDEGWQHFLMADAEAAGRLDDEWRASSWHPASSSIEHEGRQLVADARLAETLRPWVRSRPRQLAARLARRPY